MERTPRGRVALQRAYDHFDRTSSRSEANLFDQDGSRSSASTDA